jgi:hypothetical protein
LQSLNRTDWCQFVSLGLFHGLSGFVFLGLRLVRLEMGFNGLFRLSQDILGAVFAMPDFGKEQAVIDDPVGHYFEGSVLLVHRIVSLATIVRKLALVGLGKGSGSRHG